MYRAQNPIRVKDVMLCLKGAPADAEFVVYLSTPEKDLILKLKQIAVGQYGVIAHAEVKKYATLAEIERA